MQKVHRPSRDNNLFFGAGCSGAVSKEKEDRAEYGQDLDFCVTEEREDGGHIDIATADAVIQRSTHKGRTRRT